MALVSKILNSAGKPIVFTGHAEKIINHNQSIANSLGYDIDITTLTAIMQKVTEQKFFQVAPADYLPVRVGQGSWSQVLTTYRSFTMGGAFAEGIVNTGGQNARLAVADGGVDAINVNVYNWAKSIGWSIMDLQQAAKAGNWDLVTTKEKARKTNWDLGIQETAFLGVAGMNGSGGACFGLLNLPGVTVNTTVIQKPIKDLTPAELKIFCAQVYEAYRANCRRTAVPTHFIIPESDYNGLATQASADFPIKSVLEVLRETFAATTQKADFKILPLSYADADYHISAPTIDGKQVYTMLNYEEESLRMDIPVDYTNTIANSLDSFSYQNVGYGQFTGVGAYRPLEILYFQYSVV